MKKIEDQKNDLTVILPCYNHAEYLPLQLNRLQQNLGYIRKIIFIDDCSTDGSYQLFQEFKSKNKYEDITLIKNSNNIGGAKSVNNGIALVNTKYFTIIAADDEIERDLYKKANEVLLKNKNVGFLITNIKIINEDKVYYHVPIDSKLEKNTFYSKTQAKLLLNEGKFTGGPGQTLIYNTINFRKYDFIDDSLGNYMDYYPQIILAKNHGFCHVNEVLGTAYIRKTSFHKKQFKNLILIFKTSNNFIKKLKQQGMILKGDSYPLFYRYASIGLLMHPNLILKIKGIKYVKTLLSDIFFYFKN